MLDSPMAAITLSSQDTSVFFPTETEGRRNRGGEGEGVQFETGKQLIILNCIYTF